MTNQKHSQTVLEHLLELRKRLTIVAVFLISGTIAGLFIKDQLMRLLLEPLEGQRLIYTSPGGGVDFIFKTAIFFGVLVSVPIIVSQLLGFIKPAIPEKVNLKMGKILLLSYLLAILGALFAYYVALPRSLNFLIGFSNSYLQSLISTNEYLDFFMIYIVGSAMVFQLPLIMSIINKANPLDPKSLFKKQRFVVLVSFIIAAILTPTPDPVNQTLMAGPMIGLYQVGVMTVWAQKPRRNTDELLETSDQFVNYLSDFHQHQPEDYASVQTRPLAAHHSRPRKPARSMDGFTKPSPFSAPRQSRMQTQTHQIARTDYLRPPPTVSSRPRSTVDGLRTHDQPRLRLARVM